MLKKVIIIIALSLGSTLLIAGNAFTLTIDFRDTYYSAAAGLGSFYSDKHKLTLIAVPESDPDDPNPDPYLTWYADDGVGGGGSSYEEDEWELEEYLEIVFDTSVVLSEIHLTDLFFEEREGQPYAEGGMVFFYAESETDHPFDGRMFSQAETVLPSPASNGEYVIDVASLIGADSLVKKIRLTGFGYVGPDGSRQDHEFSVAGLTVNPVPEPATMLLLGSGLVGLAGFRKRLRRKESRLPT